LNAVVKVAVKMVVNAAVMDVIAAMDVIVIAVNCAKSKKTAVNLS